MVGMPEHKLLFAKQLLFIHLALHACLSKQHSYHYDYQLPFQHTTEIHSILHQTLLQYYHLSDCLFMVVWFLIGVLIAKFIKAALYWPHMSQTYSSNLVLPNYEWWKLSLKSYFFQIVLFDDKLSSVLSTCRYFDYQPQ
jgi:hypothetical protein